MGREPIEIDKLYISVRLKNVLRWAGFSDLHELEYGRLKAAKRKIERES